MTMTVSLLSLEASVGVPGWKNEEERGQSNPAFCNNFDANERHAALFISESHPLNHLVRIKLI